MILRFRPVAFLATVVLVSSACSGAVASPSTAPVATGPAASAGASAPAASQAANIKEGGNLIVGLPGDEMVLADPTLVSDSNSSYIMENVIEGLVGLKPGTTSELVPVLATDLPTASADGLTYTFKLQTGVKFHDGTTFDSAAVKYNYDRQKNAPKGLQNAYNYYYGAVFGGFGDASNIKSIDTPDASTVVFHLGHPQTNFLLSQTLPQFGMQSPTALKDGDADNPNPAKSPYAQGTGGTGKSMVGTGPFMFKEWVVGDHVTLVKNPDYWNAAGKAHLDEIKYKPYADQTAELNALEAGDIDFAQIVNAPDIATIQANAKLQVIQRGDSCNEGLLQMNRSPDQSDDAKAVTPKPVEVADPAAHKLLQNDKIRQAIGYALNKQGYLDAFYAGTGAVANNWMPPSAPYFKQETIPTYDPQKAKDLIASSGVAAADLKTTLFYPSDVVRPYMPDPKGMAQAIAADLQAVGFQVQFGTAGWHAGYLTDESVGAYPMWLLGWTCDWGGPDNFLDTAFFHFNGDKPNSEFAYGPPDLLAAFQKAEQATDPAAAAAAWGDAQDILARDLPTIPIVNSKPPAAASADVKGFVGAGNLEELFNSVWLDR